jgi:2-hydroxy-6-oxonona-2,4-dienedioate hydrolase
MATRTQYTDESTKKVQDLGWIKIGYNDAGTGNPPVILLHGAGAGASSWSNFVLNFSVFAEDFRTIAMDQPGYGKSDPWVAKSEPRNTANARAVKELMDKLGIEKASLLGNSMGGGTALAFAIDYPDRLHKMVLMGSGGGGPTLFGQQPSEGGKALQACYFDQSFETFRRFFDIMLYNGKAVSDDVLRARVDSISLAHIEAWKESRGGPQRSVFSDLSKIETPTLIIQGRNDRVVAPESSLQLLSVLPNSQLHMFNRCGHWVQYEHADEFNDMVKGFLKKN